VSYTFTQRRRMNAGLHALLGNHVLL